MVTYTETDSLVGNNNDKNCRVINPLFTFSAIPRQHKMPDTLRFRGCIWVSWVNHESWNVFSSLLAPSPLLNTNIVHKPSGSHFSNIWVKTQTYSPYQMNFIISHSYTVYQIHQYKPERFTMTGYSDRADGRYLLVSHFVPFWNQIYEGVTAPGALQACIDPFGILGEHVTEILLHKDYTLRETSSFSSPCTVMTEFAYQLRLPVVKTLI